MSYHVAVYEEREPGVYQAHRWDAPTLEAAVSQATGHLCPGIAYVEVWERDQLVWEASQ